ncbi:MAG: aminopeptidase [Thioploca sp.]|nr:aminopeptidase [Thioploca sp.]
MLKLHLLILVSLIFTGCTHFAYYAQAVRGQWNILSHMQPITKIVTQSSFSIQLQQRLRDILKIRRFASQVLHLPDNQSYTYYADLDRPYAVWTVFAAPHFALQLKQWCFPMIGCVSYRGYFNAESAQALAQQLRAEGYDVYVAGVAAYSTLGWFNDPVLNTMLTWSKVQIAGLIFHELAHQQLYIKDDTAFNESFASTVEEFGVERWLAQYGTPEEIIEYQHACQQHKAFVNLILATRYQLQQLYQQPGSPKQLTAAKINTFNTLRTRYTVLKNERWPSYTGYDSWFAHDLNNAKLLSVATYQDWVPAFQELLAQLDGNLSQFYQQVTQISQLPVEQRQAYLQQLMITH